MAYQETTTTGYGTRVGNSFKGIFTGFLMIIGGTILLWWNEGSNKKTGDAIDDAYDVTQLVSDISTVDPSLSGKMIHATGTASTEDILSDGLFGVSVNAIYLEREVEYYQWVEHTSSQSKDKLGGSQETTTTYTYDMQWVSEPVNSSEFKDPAYKGKNSVLKQVQEQKSYATNVKFGAYALPERLIRSISGEEPAQVDPNSPAFISFRNSVSNAAVTASGNVVYIGASPSAPQVGDVRIKLNKINPSHLVTIWAQVSGNTFCAYTHKNGKTICDLTMGVHSLDEVKQSAESSNSIWTWVFRFIGFLVVYWGFCGIFGILVTLLKVIPALASIANFGTSLISGILAFVWSLLIIIIAWVFYRPIVAILLLAAVGGLVYYLVMRSKKAKEENQNNNNDQQPTPVEVPEKATDEEKKE